LAWTVIKLPSSILLRINVFDFMSQLTVKACNTINKCNTIWIVVLVIHTSILLQAVNFFGLCKHNTLIHSASFRSAGLRGGFYCNTSAVSVSSNGIKQWCMNSTQRSKSATCMMYLGLLKNGYYFTDVLSNTFTHIDRGKCKCATAKKQNFELHWTFHNKPHDYIFKNKHDIALWNLRVLFQGSCIGYLSGVI
jgi:hypothetical protein